MSAPDSASTAISRAEYLEALGPKPAGEPPRWPGANAIRRGEAGEFPRVAEDGALLIGRAQECFQGLRPANGWHGWLVDQIAVSSVRLERYGRVERRLRDLVVLRAELSWDENRAAMAEGIGAGISANPRGVAIRLRSDSHGCDWLIARWARLALAAQEGAGWSATEVGQAHDLLGTPLDARREAPGLVVRFEGGRAVAEVPGPLELAAREVAGLRKRKAELVPLEAMDRAMVEADLVIEPTPELRQLGRHEAMLRGWIRWLVGQVRLDPPGRRSPPELYPRLPQVEPEAAAEGAPGAEGPPAAAAEVRAEVEAAEVEFEAKPFGCRPPRPRIASGTRVDPKGGREEGRREARRKKRESRRA